MVRWWIALLLFVSRTVFAGLTLWQPVGYNHIFVLPESVTPEIFLQQAKLHPKHSRYVQDLRFSSQDTVSNETSLKGFAEDRSLLIANEPTDHNPKQIRVRNFSGRLTQSLVMPVGAAYRLNSEEREKFYSELVKHFNGFFPMGGDDVTPSTYNEKVTWARGFDLFRDVLEIELLQYVYKESNRKIFAICRGMQITCVALGGKLHQDLEKDLGIQEEHKEGAVHEILLTGPKDHVGTEFLSKFSEWKGNSWHHQALDKNSLENTPLAVIAESREGVVEAAASADNRVLLLQSHPEKAEAPQAERFFSHLRAWLKEPVIVDCGVALKSSP